MNLHLMKSDYVKKSAVLVLSGAIVAGCAPQIAVVSEKAPARFQHLGENHAVAKRSIAPGIERASTGSARSIARRARDSLHYLTQARDTEARRCYNFAVAGIFSVIRTARLDPWTKPVQVGANNEVTLTGKWDPAKPEQNPALYEFVPTDSLRYHGAYVKDDVKRDGIGAPLVAVRHLTPEKAAELYAPPAIYYGVTGVAEFEGSRCILSIKDPLAAETVTVEGHGYPMGANFTGALAMTLAREKPQKLGLCATPASGGIRLNLPRRPVGTLQSKQYGRPCHTWTDGYTRHVGANDKRFAQRQGHPAQLPVLVLQLPQRLSLSL